jgi:DNA integrity scanning protein DisA with diadenylate cyclase activity
MDGILACCETKETQKKCRRVATLRVEIEPTIPVFDRSNTFYALHRAAIMIGRTRVKDSQNIVTLYQESLVFLKQDLAII